MLKFGLYQGCLSFSAQRRTFFLFSRFPLHQERRFRATLRVIKTVWDN
ncbi:hypothetical protein SAMN05444376_2004 [Bacteroides clarus YIT 12056]|uniref:Uncharacterized protein n=1 Tax=Bacteroides clarus YIT 12056 TaxID=762984 RepID=A0ABP2KRT4_9BACE|nr:hypothetical protein HMPREF9445_01826 [Bacteroides clarus YIT 12056]SHG91222.1 hypothetical protein SAMN05444376_2004 [Bacteroides clarus YIT 12056]